jgi:hypothetical protein
MVLYGVHGVLRRGAGKTEQATGPSGKSIFSAGFRELTDTRLGKEVATRPKISIFCFIYKLVLIVRLRRTAT